MPAALATAFVTGALSAAVALVRRRVGPRGLRLANTLSGLGIMGIGGLLGWRAARHS